MGKQDIARAARQRKRQRVLGHGAVCTECGWSGRSALTKSDGSVLCYECRCHGQGKSGVEQHHHLGRTLDPATVPTPGNIHRDLSDRQQDWPQEIRANSQRDPLVWLAAALLGLRDHLGWWVDWLDRIARWFIALSTALAARDGDHWWTALDVVPMWQEAST